MILFSILKIFVLAVLAVALYSHIIFYKGENIFAVALFGTLIFIALLSAIIFVFLTGIVLV